MHRFIKSLAILIPVYLILSTAAYCKLTNQQLEAEQWREKGIQLFDEWKLDESTTAFQKSLALNPNNAGNLFSPGTNLSSDEYGSRSCNRLGNGNCPKSQIRRSLL